jgi:hypothetical protein
LYTATLVVTKVTDGLSSKASQVTVTVGVPPIAVMANTAISGVRLGDQVLLDGSGSSAPDGNGPVTFNWTVTGRPANSSSDRLISDAASAHAVFSPDARGIFTVTLAVTNTIGFRSEPVKGSITVGLNPQANAGPDQAVETGKKVTLNGEGSMSPDEGLPLSYAWEFVSRPAGSSAALADPASPHPTFIADKEGIFVVSLKVTDPAGFQSMHDEVEVRAKEDHKSGGGCFIATAAYGSPLAPQVRVLRYFRDTRLLTNRPGRLFVRVYYAFSPLVARIIRRHETLKAITRLFLYPLIQAVSHPFLFVGMVTGLSIFGILHLGKRRTRGKRQV